MATLVEVCRGLPLDPLPPFRPRDPTLSHAPVRTPLLSQDEKKVGLLLSFIATCDYTSYVFLQLALRNALRYFPPRLHSTLAPEFAKELLDYGHIYMYRFRPAIEMKAYPFNEYPNCCGHAATIMHMIMNNLDPRVAQVRGT